MDSSKTKAQAEIESADVLLDIGVSIPLMFIKIPFVKRKIIPRVAMRRPTLGSLVRIAKLYKQMGVLVEDLPKLTKEQQFELLINHGNTIIKIVMLAILRDRLRIMLFGRMLRWVLKWYVSDAHLTAINREFAPLFGSRAFVNITKSVEVANPLTPRLGQ